MNSEEPVNEEYELFAMSQNPELNDLVNKFRSYKTKMEGIIFKLREADAVVEQLKTELSISREVETSLRNQMASAQNRLVFVQKNNAKIMNAAGRFRQNEEAFLNVERKVDEIEEEFQKIKTESQNILRVKSEELDLLKKFEYLKQKFANRENEIKMLKRENQAISKQKRDSDIQAEHEYKKLKLEVEEIRKALKETQSEHDQALQLYKKQVADQELTIKGYERERKSLLEDFAMPQMTEGTSNAAWADSTVTSVPENRSSLNLKPVESPMDFEFEEEGECFANTADTQGEMVNVTTKHFGFKPKKSSKQKHPSEFSFNPPPTKKKSFFKNRKL